MELTISPQKILRTGDIVIDKNTKSLGTIHYVIEKGGQSSFEKEVAKLEAIQFDNGERIVTLPIEQIELRSK